MKPFTRLGLLTFALTFSMLTQAADKLTLLTENYPPFNMSIEDKNFARSSGIDGISADIVREMMKRAKINYSMTLRSPWSRIYNMTRKKSNYGLFSTTLTEERKPLFKWVGPLVENGWGVFKKDGSQIQISSLEDLKKYKVGGYKGDASTEFVKSHGIKVIETALDKYNAEKLESGRIDLWISSRFTSSHIAETAGVPAPVAIHNLKNVDLYLALNLNTSDAIVKRLQAALDSMKKDGKFDELMNNYL
ncbi:amino acid ABC transporter substrate-binding protein [Endozoicomonas sp. OPT23]|uniref:substrate-binding periplasmic protein n=1 Tax=Endozoicomonas sp. OPT23 TaxID=2072845 RepID=UPI00129BD27B|nr:ABC transporter substrate-binding protein [Endozoicomonas sp. OPT23]MRI32742.1 amino acid ABC transporter substrate-binding protein [Endozoicomonas sp. OPT23]